MSINVETPPQLSGAAEQQLKQLYSYLFRLSEHLNVALNNMPENGQTSHSGQQLAAPTAKAAETYDELRALIVNTAELTRSEMDRLETELHGEYESVSEAWGSYQEEMDAAITATAREVVQSYGYEARLDTLDTRAAGFAAYQQRSEGYIRSGFVDYDSSGVPIVGIAIGQNLVSTTVTIDGETYRQLDKTQSCAFYTADKVSFRINGAEVAYVSNRKLYIHDAEITGDVVLGGDWLLSMGSGFVVKWIGG